MCIHHLQDGSTAMDLARNIATFECLRAAGGKMPEFTDENKNTLLLGYARNGRAGHVRTVLEAGANAAHTDEVHVCARSESGGMRVGVHVWVCVCVCKVTYMYSMPRSFRREVYVRVCVFVCEYQK